MKQLTSFAVCAAVLLAADVSAQARLQSSDLLRLRAVTAVQLSPDASRVAYVVENNDGAGRPYGQLWVLTVADGKRIRFGGEKEPSGNPEWSPEGQSIAYRRPGGGNTWLSVAPHG